jgi:hypothetical protein
VHLALASNPQPFEFPLDHPLLTVIVDPGGARGGACGDVLGGFQVAIVFQICCYAGCPKRMAGDLIGVESVSRMRLRSRRRQRGLIVQSACSQRLHRGRIGYVCELQALQRRLQLLVNHVGINHSCAQVGVPEGLLDHPDLPGRSVEPCGKRVP